MISGILEALFEATFDLFGQIIIGGVQAMGQGISELRWASRHQEDARFRARAAAYARSRGLSLSDDATILTGLVGGCGLTVTLLRGGEGRVSIAAVASPLREARFELATSRSLLSLGGILTGDSVKELNAGKLVLRSYAAADENAGVSALLHGRTLDACNALRQSFLLTYDNGLSTLVFVSPNTEAFEAACEIVVALCEAHRQTAYR